MSGGSARAVFLDRDGVLVVPERRDGRSFAPSRLEDLAFYPDAARAVGDLKDAGFIVIVFTNQPDVGAGLVRRETIEAMHRRLRREIPVDDIEVSYLTREQALEQADRRRKPGIGMLLDAARRWQLDLGVSYVVGDRASDIEAGTRAGCTSLFIDLGYAAEDPPTRQAATVAGLGEAVAWIRAEEARRAEAERPEGIRAAEEDRNG